MDYSDRLNNPTFVTGLWNIGRDDLNNTSMNYDWRRSFETYKGYLDSLLSTGLNIIVYGDKTIETLVKKHLNAKFVEYDQQEFYKSWFFNKVNTIRTSKDWYDQPTAQWLKNSPQAKLPLYATIQFNKIHFIKKAVEYNPFNSKQFYWLDAGITKNHSVDLLRNMVPDLRKYSKFIFFSHYYVDNTEIHGFLREGVHKYCNMPFIERIMKGFFFGGDVSQFDQIFSLSETILLRSLEEGYLGLDETIFTIMSYQRPDLFDKVIITTCDNVPQFL
jgi:hypothetical protein